jgi:hypothetical protein
MPITTRTVALGIPPRLHEPNPKAKPGSMKPTKSKVTTSKKRAASESDGDNEEEESVSEDLEPVKKKKARKRQHIDTGPEDEVEVVDVDAAPPKEVEEVDENPRTMV